MITRYYEPKDAVPHEENLLILSSSGSCYGHDFTDIVEEIREGIRGDKLLIEEYFHSLDDLKNRDKLIQNSVWIIHWEECLEAGPYPSLTQYLETRSYPNEAEIIICVDGQQKKDKVESKYPRVAVAPSKEFLVPYALGYLNSANPVSRGGTQKIMNWNNEVCNDLGVT